MSPSERRLWAAVNRRSRALSPTLAASLLRAFDRLRDSMSDAELARVLQLGFADAIAAKIVTDAVWESAMAPVREQMRRGVIDSVRYFQKFQLPAPPKTMRELGFSFNYLSPHVVPAIRALEDAALLPLKDSARAVVREAVERGLREGASSRAIGKEIRRVIGLGPEQLQQIANFRDALSGAAGRSVTEYNLRNRTVDRLLAKGPLTPEQIDRYTEAYRKARIANNATSVARTAAVNAQKSAQALAWQDAIDKGIVDGDRLLKKWISVGDDRVRPEHVKMNGETVPFDATYSNGEDVPGESVYNCRCISRVFLARAS